MSKVIQITAATPKDADDPVLWALCQDGGIWELKSYLRREGHHIQRIQNWQRVPPPPARFEEENA